MALELTLRQRPEVPLEVEGVLPNRLRAMSREARDQVTIYHGKEKVALAEWFDLQGSLDDDLTMIWHGELERVHWVGAGLEEGTIQIDGSVGRHVGSEMRGGRIEVAGSAGDWLGAEMRGGTIEVQGDAGHLVGAAYRGSPIGMRGGTIVVHGGAGNELGHSMRRGLIGVAGSAGDLVGFNMKAGTIVVGGEAGIRHGAEMVRGSLIFLEASVPLLPSFRRAGRFESVALRLIARTLADAGFPKEWTWGRGTMELYHGDLLAGGRGEMWVGA